MYVVKMQHRFYATGLQHSFWPKPLKEIVIDLNRKFEWVQLKWDSRFLQTRNLLMGTDGYLFVLDGASPHRTEECFDSVLSVLGVFWMFWQYFAVEWQCFWHHYSEFGNHYSYSFNTQIVIQVHWIGHLIHHCDFYLRTNERFALQEEFDRPCKVLNVP